MARRFCQCSYCGTKYAKGDDKALEDNWARFEVEIGNDECYDKKVRVSCSDEKCRELMRDELFATLGPRKVPVAPL